MSSRDGEKPAAKPSGGIRTLADLNQRYGPDPDGEPDDPTEYYTGGEKRRLDDPENAPFLESIRRSECPKELEPADGRSHVQVKLMKRDDKCPEPEKVQLPFQGTGRTLSGCPAPHVSTFVGEKNVEQPAPSSQPSSLKEVVSQLGETLSTETLSEESFRRLPLLLASIEQFGPMSVGLNNVKLLLRDEYWQSWEDYATALRHQGEVERRQQGPPETTPTANEECQELQTQIRVIDLQLHATRRELSCLRSEEQRLSDQLSFTHEALLAAEKHNEEVRRAKIRRLSRCYLDADRLVIRDTTRKLVLGKICRLLERM